MPKLLTVAPLSAHRLAVRYDDGAEGVVDLADLAGRGVFAAWAQPGAFEQVEVGEYGQLFWSDALELCADAVYLRLTGKSPAEVMPELHETALDA